MKFPFTSIAIHITDKSNIKVNNKMKVYLKAFSVKNPHHAEASQLIFIGRYLKITRTIQNF